jgi:ABC-type uncharacterized transport system substrate-binding protein
VKQVGPIALYNMQLQDKVSFMLVYFSWPMSHTSNLSQHYNVALWDPKEYLFIYFDFHYYFLTTLVQFAAISGFY